MARSHDQLERITYEPWASDPKDILWPVQPHQRPTPQESRAFARRVERLINQYTRNSRPVIQTASLRGPFDDRWSNPWKSQSRPSRRDVDRLASGEGRVTGVAPGHVGPVKNCQSSRQIPSVQSIRPPSRGERLEVLSPWLKVANSRRPRSARPSGSPFRHQRGVAQEVRPGIPRSRRYAALPGGSPNAPIIHYSSPPPSPTGTWLRNSQHTNAAASSLLTPNASVHSENDQDAHNEPICVNFMPLNTSCSDDHAYKNADTGDYQRAVITFHKRTEKAVHKRAGGDSMASTFQASHPIPSDIETLAFDHVAGPTRAISAPSHESKNESQLEEKHKITMSMIWPDGIAESEWSISQRAIELRGGPCSQVSRLLSQDEIQEQIYRVQSLAAEDSQSLGQRSTSQAPEITRRKPKAPATFSKRKPGASPDQGLDEVNEARAETGHKLKDSKRPRPIQFDTPEAIAKVPRKVHKVTLPEDSPMPFTQMAMLSALESFKAGLLSPDDASEGGPSITPFRRFTADGNAAKMSVQDANTQALQDDVPLYGSDSEAGVSSGSKRPKLFSTAMGDADGDATKENRASLQEGPCASQLTQTIVQAESMLNVWDVDSLFGAAH